MQDLYKAQSAGVTQRDRAASVEGMDRRRLVTGAFFSTSPMVSHCVTASKLNKNEFCEQKLITKYEKTQISTKYTRIVLRSVMSNLTYIEVGRS